MAEGLLATPELPMRSILRDRFNPQFDSIAGTRWRVVGVLCLGRKHEAAVEQYERLAGVRRLFASRKVSPASRTVTWMPVLRLFVLKNRFFIQENLQRPACVRFFLAPTSS